MRERRSLGTRLMKTLASTSIKAVFLNMSLTGRGTVVGIKPFNATSTKNKVQVSAKHKESL